MQGWRLQAADKRSAAGIACPLGHAMEPAIVTIDMEEELTERSSVTKKEVRFIAVLQADDLKDGPPASPETVMRGSSELIVSDSADEGTERPLFCQVWTIMLVRHCHSSSYRALNRSLYLMCLRCGLDLRKP